MNKNTLISVLSFLLFCLPIEMNAQADDEPAEDLYLSVLVKPLNGNISAFEEALAEHHQNYHENLPMIVYWMASGETYGGYYQLVHGPTNWTNLSSYSPSKEHDDHWNDEVMPHVEDISGYTFWKRNSDIMMNPVESVSQSSFTQVFNIKNGEGARFMRALQDWHKANVESEFEGSYSVYSRQMSGQNQIALVVNLQGGWSELDSPPQTREGFENTHGKTMWDLFMDDYVTSVENVEIGMRFFRPDLGSQINQ